MRARDFNVVPDHASAYDVIPSHASFHVRHSREHAAHGSFSSPKMAIMMTTIASHANPVHVTTLPDLSASLPTFNGSGTPTFKHWIEVLERIQRLARWEGPTLLAIAQGKLRGVAADWHASTGRQLTTWTIWKAGLQEQFGEQLSMIQWQQKVTALTQKAGESLQQYTFAKLKTMSRCPVPITDKERIEYLVQGIRDDQVATSIAVQRPRTVDDFLSIVSEVDRALDHARLIRSAQPAEQFARQPGRPQLQSATPRTDSTPTEADEPPTPDSAESPPRDHVAIHASAELVDAHTSLSPVDEASAHPPSRQPLGHRTQPPHLQDYDLSMQDYFFFSKWTCLGGVGCELQL
ncbi:hypothetical protein HPB49_021509 [Dermacentor silvarum]|uniref:Uncharacterized protein n=1 Tax=Dermacentor silvarum TaxID=543639 RepID=A0ACB8D828_DERSI|nr:hypothetical protein HPB49_021509 [Dermacentor silvarum]